MTRDDIIRMALDAGLVLRTPGTGLVILTQWERFAAVVAAEKDKEIAALKEERRRDMAEIYSLRESEESLREEVERLRESLKRHGMHNADCFLRGECNCGLDAALQGETAIWSACHDPRE